MLKIINLAFLLIVCLTACSPRIGVGVGGIVASGDSIAASEVVADSEHGVHGSISMGTDMGL
ncbi:hypothetical protein TSL6_05080 [Sulfurovum sp. TSL6]|uniref:hypothetical protein n=1 Tax=Sulfurovum sp. TSL6 TaxID=2826995 RepID=UPI001CC79361|nr:hypothetical protein [Sulfurovum sp. TSL6]GIU00002.1 hypothetical protein TSL6_05080 [Sulfurovum sp. TSL6]